MMRAVVYRVLMLWLICGCVPVWAADPVLTLEQALGLALQGNIAVENATLEVSKAESRIAAERTERLPKLKLEARSSYNLTDQSFTFQQGALGTFPATGPIPAESTEIASQSGTTSVVSAGVVQPLLQQRRIGFRIDRAEIGQDIAQESLRSHRQGVIRQVKQQYYEILKTQNELAATAESIVFYEALNQLVARYVQQQTALKYESLEVASRLAEVQHKALIQRHQLAAGKEHLNELLGRSISTPFKVASIAAAGTTGVDQDQAISRALSSRPDIQEAALKIVDAELQTKIKKSEYLPDVDFEVRYSQLYDVEFIPDNVAYAGVTLRWQFYDWGRKRAQLAERNAAEVQARNQLEELQAQTEIEVNRRIRELDEARTRLPVASSSRDAAREKLRVLMNQYREQSALLKDVLQAESELADANEHYNNATLAILSAEADLEKAIGAE